MSTPLRCLLVEDSEDDALLVQHQLHTDGLEVTCERVETAEAMHAALDRQDWDFILSDYKMPRFTGAAALSIVRARGLDLPFIVISGTIGEDVAVAMMKAGAHDYLTKGALARLVPAIRRELREAVVRRERAVSERTLQIQNAALTAAANAIVITERDGVIVWANPAFSALSGYTLDEAVGRNPRDLVKSGQHGREFYQDLWNTILAGRVWHGEVVNRSKDGSLHPEEMTITPVRDAAGEIAHFIAVKLDRTERLQAEAALLASERRYRQIFDFSPLPMWLLDASTFRFLAVNEAAVQQYGYSREEFLTLTSHDIRLPEDVPAMLMFAAQLQTDATRSGEFRHRRKDGSVLRVESVVRAFTFDDRDAYLVLAQDVTEKKLLEQRFLRTQQLESLGMLAAGIAHDLNNVLAPIMIAGPLLRPGLSAERDLKILDLLEHSAKRGAGLVKQILGFARAGSGEFQPIQVKHLARDLASIIEETFPKSITLTSHIPADLWPVQGNTTQLHQVLLNLCVNARDAMPQGGMLTLRLANRQLSAEDAGRLPGVQPGAWLEIEVSDTGSGIAPEILEHIWEPFYTTKEPGKGTGMGLSTVRGIVATHGGVVDVQTTVGMGTTMRVFLPAAVDLASPDGARAQTPRGHGELILIVDDEPGIRSMIEHALGRSGYRTLCATDGAEAMAVFTTHAQAIALVVTDVDMPRLSGAALALALRELRPDLPLLVMSGLASGGDRADEVFAARALAQQFLLKPFSPEVLLSAIHRLLHP